MRGLWITARSVNCAAKLHKELIKDNKENSSMEGFARMKRLAILILVYPPNYYSPLPT